MKTTVLVGPSCSGKTSFAKMLEIAGWERIITYTTRPARSDEVDGVDYHFVSRELFDQLEHNGFFLETRSHTKADEGFVSYGTPTFGSDDKTSQVVVLDPLGALAAYNSGTPVRIIWLDTPKGTRTERALRRGDNPEEIKRRLDADERDFADFEKYGIHDLRVGPSTSQLFQVL